MLHLLHLSLTAILLYAVLRLHLSVRRTRADLASLRAHTIGARLTPTPIPASGSAAAAALAEKVREARASLPCYEESSGEVPTTKREGSSRPPAAPVNEETEVYSRP